MKAATRVARDEFGGAAPLENPLERPRASLLRWVWATTIILFVYHVYTSRHFVGPGIFDEAGYLGNARNLVDANPVWAMGESPFYRAAYSLLIVPTEFLGAVEDRYRGALAVNGLLVAALVPMLYTLARRLTGCQPRAALGGAVVAATLPAVLMWSKMAMAEALAVSAFTATVLALCLAVGDGPRWQQLLFGPCLAVLYGTHGRFLAPIVLGFAVLLVVGWAQRAWFVAFGNVLAASVGIAAMAVLHAYLKELRWSSAGYRGDQVTSLHGVLQILSSLSDQRKLIAAAVGQSWYLVATTLGLVSFGLVSLLFHARGRPTAGQGRIAAGSSDGSRRTGGRVQTLRAALGAQPSRLVAAYGALSCLGMFLTSWLFMFRSTAARPDAFVYGRYNETCVPLLVALGIGALLRGRDRKLLVAGSGLTLFVLAAGLVNLVLIRSPGRYTATAGGWNAVNVFGINPFINAEGAGNADPDYRMVLAWVTAGAFVGVLAILGITLAARGRVWGTAGLTVICLSISLPVGRADLSLFGDYISSLYPRLTLPVDLESMGQPTAIGLYRPDPWRTGPPGYQWQLPETKVIPFRSFSDLGAEVPVVIGPLEWPAARQLGARLASTEPVSGLGVWVLPGPLQDELAHRGWVVPADYAGRLPEPARRGAVELLNSPPASIASGRTTSMKVRVRHLGQQAPWLAGARSLTGRLAVSAAWRPPEGQAIEEWLGWAGLGELPRSLRPQEAAEVELPISAVSPTGEPLPPGPYRITLELHEVGVSSFTTPATAPITLAVRVRSP